MVQMAFLIRHMVVLLGFSYLLSLAALPTTRSLRADGEDLFVQQSLGALDLRVGEELFDVGLGEGEGFIEGRMNMESTVLDYPGTGANNHHDPKTPGKAN